MPHYFFDVVSRSRSEYDSGGTVLSDMDEAAGRAGACSLAARGMWIEMLCVMGKEQTMTEPRGPAERITGRGGQAVGGVLPGQSTCRAIQA